MDKAMIANVLRASFANQRNQHNWSGERKFERIEDYSGFNFSILFLFFQKVSYEGAKCLMSTE